MNKIKILLAIVVLGLLAFSIYSYARNSDVVGTDILSPKNEVTCQVKADDDLFTSDDIVSASCTQTGKCYTIFSFMSLNPLKVDKTVRLVNIADKTIVYGKKDFSTYIGMGTIVGFTACVPSGVNQAEVQLFNSEGGLEDERSVVW